MFEDRYEQALIALVKSKGAGRAKPAPGVKEPKTPSNVVSLMDALKRSIQAEKSPAPSSRPRLPRPRLRARGRPARAAAPGKPTPAKTSERKSAAAKSAPLRKAS